MRSPVAELPAAALIYIAAGRKFWQTGACDRCGALLEAQSVISPAVARENMRRQFRQHKRSQHNG